MFLLQGRYVTSLGSSRHTQMFLDSPNNACSPYANIGFFLDQFQLTASQVAESAGF